MAPILFVLVYNVMYARVHEISLLNLLNTLEVPAEEMSFLVVVHSLADLDNGQADSIFPILGHNMILSD